MRWRRPRRPAQFPAGRTTIRIATANFGPLDANKLARQYVTARLAHVIRQFELVALQDVRGRDPGVLLQLLEAVNAPGRRYDFAAPTPLDGQPGGSYCAVVFDADRLQIDRTTVARVEDPERRFLHAPLVASFRALGPAESEAFTFTLVNVHTPAERTAEEGELLAGVFRAVRDGGRGEDDILLAGEIGVDEGSLGPLARLPNLACATSGLPTTLRGNRQLDNILFDRRQGGEFTYRCGVLDVVRQLGISAAEAGELGSHLPVWAEFSVFEGGQAGHTPTALP